MYKNSRIALVIPSFNEEKLIGNTLRSVPALIDRVYVVDDNSTDSQNQVVEAAARQDPRVRLLKHSSKLGPGAAIITGYQEALKEGFDIAVVVGGDNQMDLSEVSHFLDPIINGEADYAKGNRFLLGKFEETIRRMPKIRFVANWAITALTKVASGYYHIMDVVDGYTAISRKALERVDWSAAWKGYGYPMDFLVRLNAYGFRVVDVPRTAIYLAGERQSQIRPFRYFARVSPMLLRAFFWRLRFKYFYLDFHPLALFYGLSLILIPFGLAFGIYLVVDKLAFGGFGVTAPKAILASLALISGLQFMLFAMLFDRQESIWNYQKASPASKPSVQETPAPTIAKSIR